MVPSLLAYCWQQSITNKLLIVMLLLGDGRGRIVVRAHASHPKGLRFEPDSMP